MTIVVTTEKQMKNMTCETESEASFGLMLLNNTKSKTITKISINGDTITDMFCFMLDEIAKNTELKSVKTSPLIKAVKNSWYEDTEKTDWK